MYIKAILDTLKDTLPGDELTILLGSIGNQLNISREEELMGRIRELEELLSRYNIDPKNTKERGRLGSDSQRDWNYEARKMLKEHLGTIPEFDCSNWDDSNIPSSVVHGVQYMGEECTFVVRSAMSYEKTFHLTPYEWTLFDDKNTFLALRTSNSQMLVYGISENIKEVIFENNSTINLNFESERLSLDGLSALSELFVGLNIWGSGLVFNNPAYSAGVQLKDLSASKEGILKKFSSDDAL